MDFAQRELWHRGADVKQATQRLIHEAVRERSCKDNCTVMLVLLQPVRDSKAPQRTPSLATPAPGGGGGA